MPDKEHTRMLTTGKEKTGKNKVTGVAESHRGTVYLVRSEEKRTEKKTCENCLFRGTKIGNCEIFPIGNILGILKQNDNKK